MADLLHQLLAMDMGRLAGDLSAAMETEAAWDGVVKPTYPEDHVAAMRVPKGGSSCDSCEYLKDREKRLCGQPDFIKWNGGPQIPLPVDEFCSDWYEPEKDLDAYGTSEGVRKAWESRNRKPEKDEPEKGMPGDKFMREFWDKTEHNPFDPRERVVNREAAVTMAFKPHGWGVAGVLLDFIRSFEKGKGGGSRAMKFVTDLADKHKVSISLDVQPVGRGGLNKNQLLSFYKKHGFEKDPAYNSKYYMIRYPKGFEASSDELAAQFMEAAGTSEGAEKGWDTRGRGRHGSVSMMPGVRQITEKDLNELRGWKTLSRITARQLHDPEKSKAMKSAGLLANWLAGDFGEPGNFYTLTTKNGMVGILHVDSGAKIGHVHTLATRPDIIAGVTKERGVGTKLMMQAAKFAEAHGQGLHLSALDGAEGFYEKLGMHRTDPTSTLAEYEWSPEEVKAFAGAVVHAGAEMEDLLKKIEEAMDAEDEFPPLASDRDTEEEGGSNDSDNSVGVRVRVSAAGSGGSESSESEDGLVGTGPLDADGSDDELETLSRQFLDRLEAEALFNNVRITGFTGPEEEFVRAGLSRIPPELTQWVKEIRADGGMGAKHGNYDTETGIIRLNPKNFRLRMRYGRGAGWILHAETTMCHEIGHSVYEQLSPEMKQEWLAIGGWKKTQSDEGDDLAPRYREKRPGWPTYNSKWRHKKGLLLPRTYSSKNPDECFADCFSFFNLGKPQQMDEGIRQFLQQVVERFVRKYPKAMVEGPTKSYVYERTKSGNSAGGESTSEPEG